MANLLSMLPIPHFDFHEVVFSSIERRDFWDTLHYRVLGMTQRGPEPRSRWVTLHTIDVHTCKQGKLSLTPEQAVRLAGDLLHASGKTMIDLESYLIGRDLLAEAQALAKEPNDDGGVHE